MSPEFLAAVMVIAFISLVNGTSPCLKRCSTDEECGDGVCLIRGGSDGAKTRRRSKRCFQCSCQKKSQCYHDGIQIRCDCSDSAFKGDLCKSSVGVFRVQTGNGINTVSAWGNGAGTTSDPACFTIYSASGCTEHYRDPVVDEWDTLGIQTVRYSLYKGGQEVAYILFNGSGSSIMDWFSRPRVIESSYSDIFDQFGWYFFGIDVDFEERNFVIQNVVGDCFFGDLTFFVTVDRAGCCCHYDNFGGYPYIWYSTVDTSQSTGNPDIFDFADTAIISIGLE